MFIWIVSPRVAFSMSLVPQIDTRNINIGRRIVSLRLLKLARRETGKVPSYLSTCHISLHKVDGLLRNNHKGHKGEDGAKGHPARIIHSSGKEQKRLSRPKGCRHGRDQNLGICFILEFWAPRSRFPVLKREKHISEFQFGSEKAYNSEKVLLKCTFLWDKTAGKDHHFLWKARYNFGTTCTSDCLVLHEQISWRRGIYVRRYYSSTKEERDWARVERGKGFCRALSWLWTVFLVWQSPRSSFSLLGFTTGLFLQPSSDQSLAFLLPFWQAWQIYNNAGGVEKK